MTQPEFRKLVLTWDLPEEYADRMWQRYQHLLKAVTPADVENAFRDALKQVLNESQHHAN